MITAPLSYPKRFFIYQKERFPFLVHGLLIAAFSFSAIAFSRLCRGASGFIPWPDYVACALTNIVLFFLLRVSDEHKDKALDAAYRPYLPVPRGLVTLKELRITGFALLLPVTLLNVVRYPALLPFYGITLVYLLLMRYEFFAGAWLNRHQVAYIASHMVIIPLTDIYASSYDWKLHQAAPPVGLGFFFLVSYLNGIVLEIGRKLKPVEKEEPGVVSYTKLWGLQNAPWIWVILLALNFSAALAAAFYAGHTQTTYFVLSVLFLLALVPALLFLKTPAPRWGRLIEGASVLWAFGMYLTLGGIPILIQLATGR
jgi:4-hydroxybenzoate polyprenyltransferase